MMKSIVFWAIALICLTACKKDYTCECTAKDKVTGFSAVSSTEVINDTEKKAKATCSESNNVLGTWTTTCVIK